ncbi:hypothetical protein ASF19_23790 [Acidovorax sp. Leaf84]|nr:hypothetical protein ASF19_23790 [Acidovorax sp. Leaf84]
MSQFLLQCLGFLLRQALGIHHGLPDSLFRQLLRQLIGAMLHVPLYLRCALSHSLLKTSGSRLLDPALYVAFYHRLGQDHGCDAFRDESRCRNFCWALAHDRIRSDTSPLSDIGLGGTMLRLE